MPSLSRPSSPIPTLDSDLESDFPSEHEVTHVITPEDAAHHAAIMSDLRPLHVRDYVKDLSVDATLRVYDALGKHLVNFRFLLKYSVLPEPGGNRRKRDDRGALGRMAMKSTRNVDWKTIRSSARSFATHRSLIRNAPHCSLRSRTPLRSFVLSLAHSLAPELMGKRFIL